MIGYALELALPNPDNAIAAGSHVRILGLVKGETPTLAIVKDGELCGVSVPVVAIELDDQAEGREEGINTELIADKILPLIGDTELIKKCIAETLKVVGVHRELFCIHMAQHDFALRVCVTAFEGTILDVVQLTARGRPPKSLAAYPADMARLVAPLPLVCVFKAAEIVSGKLNPTCWQVESLAAQLAGYILPILALGALRAAIAAKRAISLIRTQVLSNCCAASFTRNRPRRVFVHALSIAHIGTTVKPMGVMRYA